MSYSYGKRSTANLATCSPGIQRVMYAVILEVDCSIIYGHRGKAAQNEAFKLGFSTKQWPNSNHNKAPSKAVDVLPHPSGWPQDSDSKLVKMHKIAHFYYQAGVIMTKAKELGVNLRWGGDWDMDKDFLDQTFDDLAHFEEIE